MINNKEKIFWSKESLPNDLVILLEKLSSANNISVKQLYDKYKDNVENKKKNKKNKNSKKDVLINKNNERIESKKLKDDRERLKNYKKSDTIDFENWITYFDTQKGKEELKLYTLKQVIKKKNPLKKIELLLQIKKDLLEKPDDKKYLEKQLNTIQKLNLKRIQLKCLGNKLPPLDYYNKSEFKLEDWQINVIDMIKKNTSVLVCAPTSSGKTIISTYFAESPNTLLYIVPSKPLAFQVAAIFYKVINNNINIYVEDFSYKSSNPKIIIGTPYEIETILPHLNVKLDMLVFDEIHNLNYFEGDSYERIIKLCKCTFLALSATIQNKEELIQWWKTIHPSLQIKCVSYKNRFINIQRHIWDGSNNSIEKIHPLSCLNIENLSGDNLIDLNLPFTPWDSFSVWSSFEIIDPNIYKRLDPEIIFKSKLRLDLNDSKEYEELIKTNLIKLDNESKQKVLDLYSYSNSIIEETFDIYKLTKKLKSNNMLPCIIFNPNKHCCIEIFKQLVNDLENNEKTNYPYYYDNLETRFTLYESYKKRRNELEKNLKEDVKYTKLKRYDEKELEIYRDKISDIYNKQETKIKELDIDSNLKTLKLSNLKIEYLNEMDKISIEEVDLFEKHQDFSFTISPMKSKRIRLLRNEISKKIDMKIRYENTLIQGLKRGIGIYTKNLPDIYLRIVQELAQNKELGIVISDDSLALGINMPFKTTVISGWKNSKKYDPLIYHQMIGRAGRRGLDTEGNLVFVNIDWKTLLQSKMGKLKGIKEIPINYGICKYLESPLEFNSIYKNFLNDYPENKYFAENKLLLTNYINDPLNIKIIWKLRKYNILEVIDFIDLFEMINKEKEVSKTILDLFFSNIIKIIFEKKKISIDTINNIQFDNINNKTLYEFLEFQQILHFDENLNIIEKINIIGNICKIYYNIIINKSYYKIIDKILYQSFLICKNLRFKYYKLN